jgi:hypothetical protein
VATDFRHNARRLSGPAAAAPEASPLLTGGGTQGDTMRSLSILFTVFAIAGCGKNDPLANTTWKTSTAPATVASGYDSYSLVIAFGGDGRITLTLDGKYSSTMATYPGCRISQTATGTYSDNEVTDTTGSASSYVTAGTQTTSECPDPTRNASGPLGVEATNFSYYVYGNYTIAGNTLTFDDKAAQPDFSDAYSRM